MDKSEVYPDVLGDALSFSSQRVAQLGSLVTAGARSRHSAERGQPPRGPLVTSGR